jgi:flavin-dependent dehydrogenase
VTPVGCNRINVAVLLDRAVAGTLKGNLAEGFKSLLSSSGILEAAVGLEDEPLVAGPFPAAARALWRDNLVLAGDAAGFRDPISGEGMSLALRGARECAAAVSEFIGSGSSAAFRAYERRQRTLMRNSALLARLTLTLASRPSLGRRAIANLNRRPETFRRLVSVNAGELALTALRPRDLLALAFGV